MQMLTGPDAADGLDKFYGTLKIVWRWQSYTLHRLDIATNQGTEYQRPDRAKKHRAQLPYEILIPPTANATFSFFTLPAKQEALHIIDIRG